MRGSKKPERDLRMSSDMTPQQQRLVRHSPKQYFSEFLVLKDVSFEIKKGEIIRLTGQTIFVLIAQYDLSTADN